MKIKIFTLLAYLITVGALNAQVFEKFDKTVNGIPAVDGIRSICAGDVNNNGIDDIFISKLNSNYFGTSDHKFVLDQNLTKGTDNIKYSSTCAFVDYDNDEHLDLLYFGDDVTPWTTGKKPIVLPVLKGNYAKGADVGWLSEMEAKSKKFYTSDGVEKDLFDVLKSKGINSIRLRVWVNPPKSYSNKADVVALAVRAKNKGMRLMINFHYSDGWADNKSQRKPKAWKDYNFEELKKAVYDHTFEVLSALKSNNVVPEWVQVGNESDDGILFPDGQISIGNGAGYAKLFNSGYAAVKAVNKHIKVIAHASSSKDITVYKTHFDALRNNGALWDITGMSSYPWPSNTWPEHNAKIFECMKLLQIRYQRPIMIVEVGSPVNEPLDCKNMLIDLMTKSSSMGKNGLGTFYWEPECPKEWNNYGSGAFDNTGKPTEAMDAFLINL